MRYIAVVVLVVVAQTVLAATWYVGGDGGQFDQIQSAIDVAASGDTVRIAPGYYTDSRIYSTDGWTSPVNVLVTQEELTIIGAGPDETIIGPELPWDQNDDDDSRGIVAASWFGAREVHIQDLAVRHARTGVNVEELRDARIYNCRFSEVLLGINAALGQADVRGCVFADIMYDGWGALSWHQERICVVGCEFAAGESTDVGTTSLSVANSVDVAVQSCSFRGGAVGLQLRASGSVEVSECEFSEQGQVGLYLKPGSAMEQRVSDCRFSDQDYALHIFNYAGNVSAERLIIEGVERASIYAKGALGRVEILDSWFSRGSEGVFYSRDGHAYDPTDYSMPNNWWGTAEVDSIAAWIQDAADDPEYDARVEFEPYLTEPPVPVEECSLGDIKGLFR